MDQLFAILRTLNKHRYELLVCPLLAMALIYYFTADAPKQYKTEARLYLNLQEGKSTSLSDEDLKQYQVQSYFTNTVELLKSDKTIDKVKRYVLADGAEGKGFFKAGNARLLQHRDAVIKRLAALEATNEPLEAAAFPDSVMMAFLHYHQLTTVRMKEMALSFRIMDSNFMKFELTENMPQKAQQLAIYFIDALMDENRQLLRNKIKGHKDIIEALVRQAKADLDAKVSRLEQYKVTHSIINLGEHTKAIVVYLVQLEGQRSALLARVAAGKKGRSEVMSTVTHGTDIILDVSENAEVLQLKEQLRALNKQMLVRAFEQNTVASDDAIYRNISSTREQIQAKVEELVRKTPYDPSRVQLDLVGRYINFDLDAETAADMIATVDAEIARVTGYSKRFAPYESTIGAYEQEISTAQNAYLTLLNKLTLTETIESGAAENIIEVIDRPYLPVKPLPSKRMVMVAAGGVALLVLMAGVFVIMQLLDASITSVEKFERLSRLPVIAGLPDERASKRYAHLAEATALVGQQQLFKLLQEIVTRCIGEQSILMITSSQRQEGKHFVAAKLDKLLAEAGYKIGFVDADWMSKSVHEGAFSLKEKIAHQGLVRERRAIVAHLEEMKRDHDLVVVLASPLNLSAEAGFWMEVSHHVLYLFRANRLITKVDKRVEEMLLNTRLQFLGTVINGINIENMEDYLGEIPRQRSIPRILLKKLLSRNF